MSSFETEKITDEVRAAQPGNSVEIADGAVYYQLAGPEDGEVVVLIHGMSMPSFVWDPTWEMLINEGFQVLRYDLFGRGYSDRPPTRHVMALYMRQLAELLEALELSAEKIHLIGLSFGTGIAAQYAVDNAQLVKSLTLIGPVHPQDMPAPPAKIFRTLLRIRSIAAQTDWKIIEGLSLNFYEYEDFPEFEEKLSAQFQYKGTARAIVSTMMDFDYTALPGIYEQVGRLNIPVAIFWGMMDQIADYETNQQFKKLLPGMKLHSIAAAGHLAHYERPELVNPLLLSFLKGESRG